MILQHGLVLYHGSYCAVKKIDLSFCASGKDFGRGFYLTADFNQAKKFVRTSILKAAKNAVIPDYIKKGYVSSFAFSTLKGVKFFEFAQADVEWLHCIAAHRKEEFFSDELEKWNEYDIIAGKIANDATNQVITAYINGLYGRPGKRAADEMAISLLLPNKLKEQVCFRTKIALPCLQFLESKEVLV